jgi:hypothetical protein
MIIQYFQLNQDSITWKAREDGKVVPVPPLFRVFRAFRGSN